MDPELEPIARLFEAQRSHLRAVAYRMLGSLNEADDAVQEAWLRLMTRSDSDVIENLQGWLTTVVARLCLDILRSRKSRHEESLDVQGAEPPISKRASGANPEEEAMLADSVGLALLVVLDTLPPAERVAFVLHDVFDMPFDEIARIVGRNATATRQLASRARRRVHGKKIIPNPVLKSERIVVERFLAALRSGDFEGLLSVLDPDVVVHIDSSARPPGTPAEVRGARDWATGAVAYKGFARFVQPALIDGKVGLVFAPRGKLMRVLTPKILGGKIIDVDIIADPERLSRLDLAVLSD